MLCQRVLLNCVKTTQTKWFNCLKCFPCPLLCTIPLSQNQSFFTAPQQLMLTAGKFSWSFTNHSASKSCHHVWPHMNWYKQYFSTTANSNPLSLESKSLRRYLDHIVREYQRAKTESSSNDDGVFSFERMELVRFIEMYKQKEQELFDLNQMATENEDIEMEDLLRSETQSIKISLLEHEDKIIELLYYSLEGDWLEDRDLILEVIPGVGGQEAMLFTADVLEMYQMYATRNGWTFDVILFDRSDTGGVRKAMANISGQGAYRSLRFEAGVHRVQRVPKTEKSGRVHTSTMAVAILPQPTQIEVVINPKDLKIDTFRAGGKGGQHVNKTDSAVRMTHIPSGTVVECQAHRSQIKNRSTALQILRSRLYEQKLQEQTKSFSSRRKLQIGTGARSDKIRTYNFSQDRITDHRINKSLHDVDSFMNGGENLDELFSELHEFSLQEQLLEKVDLFEEQSTLLKQS